MTNDKLLKYRESVMPCIILVSSSTCTCMRRIAASEGLIPAHIVLPNWERGRGSPFVSYGLAIIIIIIIIITIIQDCSASGWLIFSILAVPSSNETRELTSIGIVLTLCTTSSN